MKKTEYIERYGEEAYKKKLEGATPEEIKLKKLIELIKNYCEFFPDLYKWKW